MENIIWKGDYKFVCPLCTRTIKLVGASDHINSRHTGIKEYHSFPTEVRLIWEKVELLIIEAARLKLNNEVTYDIEHDIELQLKNLYFIDDSYRRHVAKMAASGRLNSKHERYNRSLTYHNSSYSDSSVYSKPLKRDYTPKEVDPSLSTRVTLRGEDKELQKAIEQSIKDHNIDRQMKEIQEYFYQMEIKKKQLNNIKDDESSELDDRIRKSLKGKEEEYN